MMKYAIRLLLFIALITSACQKDVLPLPEPPFSEPSKLEVVWQRAASQDMTRRWIHVHDVRNKKVLYSSSFALMPATLQVRNSITGSYLWTYHDWISLPSELYLTSNVFAYDNDLIIVEDNGNVYAINYNTGETFWYYTDTGWPLGSNRIADHFYTIHKTGEWHDITSSSLVRIPAQPFFSGWDTLYTQYAVPDSFPLISFPVLWVNPPGDSVLVFGESQGYNGSPSSAGRSKNMLTAWNLRTSNVLWQYVGLKGVYTAPPLVDGDRIYLMGASVYCHDLNTGNILWEKKIDGGFGDTPLAFQDILIVQTGSDGIWGFNKYTGEIIWHNKDAVGGAGRLALFEGIIYLASGHGRLCAFDAQTGRTIWNERSPNRFNPKTSEASFSLTGVAIDTQYRLLYTSDEFYIMCIKLPEK